MCAGKNGSKCGEGKCDPEARCCSLCALAAIERALVRMGPPRELRDFGASTPAEDFKAGTDKCHETGITHVFVGTSGDVTFKLHSGATITMRSLVAGVWHPVPFARVLVAQTTTAQGVIVGWC